MMKMLVYANKTAPGYSKCFYGIQAGKKHWSRQQNQHLKWNI